MDNNNPKYLMVLKYLYDNGHIIYSKACSSLVLKHVIFNKDTIISYRQLKTDIMTYSYIGKLRKKELVKEGYFNFKPDFTTCYISKKGIDLLKQKGVINAPTNQLTNQEALREQGFFLSETWQKANRSDPK